jgi:O-antigen/teichoic acid export membrane protein
MNENSRTINSIRNTLFGMIVKIIVVILSFITRTVFLYYLNIEYLGINGLFTNILTILSLAELGVGTALIYSMYKPLADNDKKAISALLNFYAKIYWIISLIIGILGLAIIPALGFIIKDYSGDENLVIIYLLFLLNTVLSYLYIYKRSIIEADQKQYIISKIQLYFNIIKSVFQIFVLIFTQNFILYLVIQILITFCENIFVSQKADKMYTFLREYKKEKISIKEKRSIWKNIKSLMIYKVAGTLLDGTDNIIISAFIGVAWVGMLSNYTLILGAFSMFASQFTSAITASVGNFIAKESRERQEFLFRVVTLVHFLIYGISFICLYILLNPFIELWLGGNFVLNTKTVFVVSINWYIYGMLSSTWVFRSTMGLFVYGKYRPLVTAFINLVVSIYLVNLMGLTGVLLGTIIARVTTNVWFDPLIIYKYGLGKSVNTYYYSWLKYLILILFNIFILSYLVKFVSGPEYLTFLIKALICLLVSSSSMLVVLGRTEEFKYLVKIIKGVVGRQ